jgi:hypothetical protein
MFTPAFAEKENAFSTWHQHPPYLKASNSSVPPISHHDAITSANNAILQ